MKVFLSWSGERSQRVAVILRDWLPQVIQVLDPYVSSEDIDKGARWSIDIAKELEASAYGIVCVTPENLDAPWINFEAGALSKALDKSRVSPLLLGLGPADVKGPLVQFQATRATEDDIWRLVVSLNNQCGAAQLEEGRLKRAFEMWWPSLEAQFAEEAKRTPGPATKSVSDPILEEILVLVRDQQKQVSLLREQADFSRWITILRQMLEGQWVGPHRVSMTLAEDGSLQLRHPTTGETLTLIDGVSGRKLFVELGFTGLTRFIDEKRSKSEYGFTDERWKQLIYGAIATGIGVRTPAVADGSSGNSPGMA
jgi:TIR domain